MFEKQIAKNNLEYQFYFRRKEFFVLIVDQMNIYRNGLIIVIGKRTNGPALI